MGEHAATGIDSAVVGSPISATKGYAASQAWIEFRGELDGVYLPHGRATVAMRRQARAIAILMTRNGMSSEDVRRALTNAIMQHHCAIERQTGTGAFSFRTELLGDVLQCALACVTEGPTHEPDCDWRAASP
jgi:hypothetical protein